MRHLDKSILTKKQLDGAQSFTADADWKYVLVTYNDGDTEVDVVYYLDDIRLCELITDPIYRVIEL